MPPQLIVCLRHGEKPETADGKEIPERPGLSSHGAERARKLRAALRPGQLLPNDAREVSRVLVPHYGDGTPLHRPFQTVQPAYPAVAGPSRADVPSQLPAASTRPARFS
jgi:broad specificity phosphatase PhoE